MAYIKMKDIDDFTYFRNRISFQMRALGIHSTKALSEKLRETGFFKRTDSMGNIHLLKASSIDKIIQKHFQHNIPNELPDSLTANHVQACLLTHGTCLWFSTGCITPGMAFAFSFCFSTNTTGSWSGTSCSIPCMVTCIKSDSTYNRQSDTNDCYNCYCFLFVFHIPFSSYLSFSFFNLSII